ncbi:hypothetical protein DFJ73DRAFT_846872 [Zopfochytrium polystomum]|nr:hypothetical protein DFJ73DRAFT_846872 [Zopfochytrium polystomum]
MSDDSDDDDLFDLTKRITKRTTSSLSTTSVSSSAASSGLTAVATTSARSGDQPGRSLSPTPTNPTPASSFSNRSDEQNLTSAVPDSHARANVIPGRTTNAKGKGRAASVTESRKRVYEALSSDSESQDSEAEITRSQGRKIRLQEPVVERSPSPLPPAPQVSQTMDLLRMEFEREQEELFKVTNAPVPSYSGTIASLNDDPTEQAEECIVRFWSEGKEAPLKIKYRLKLNTELQVILDDLALRLNMHPGRIILRCGRVAVFPVTKLDSLRRLGGLDSVFPKTGVYFESLQRKMELARSQTLQGLEDEKDDEPEVDTTKLITIQLNDNSGIPFKVKVKETITIGSLLKLFADSHGLDASKLRIELDHELISHDVESGDMLDVVHSKK